MRWQIEQKMNDEPFLLDSFAVITDKDLMQDIADQAADGNLDAQKIQRGLARWNLCYRQGAATCICCSTPILHQPNIGAYFICYSEHEDRGFASAFCFDCRLKCYDLDSFIAAAIKSMQDRGVAIVPVGTPGRA